MCWRHGGVKWAVARRSIVVRRTKTDGRVSRDAISGDGCDRDVRLVHFVLIGWHAPTVFIFFFPSNELAWCRAM